jgi:hypothetical protein
MPVGDVTASDRLWQQAAAELLPARSLARVDEKAQQVVTNVSILAAVLTGLGLLTGDQLTHSPGGRPVAIATLAIAWLSVLLAYGSQLLRVSPATAPGDVEQVKAWYGRQFRRAYAVVAAGVLSLLSLVLAGITAIVVLAASPAPGRPTVAIQLSGAGADATLTVDLSFPGLTGQQQLQATITGVGPNGSRTTLADTTVLAGANGTAATNLRASNVARYRAIDIAATTPTYTCTGVVNPAAQPTLTCVRH